VTCNAKQTNVPCIYKKGSGCLLRSSNCEGKPCDEAAHEPIACSAAVPPLAKPTRVCLDVLNAKDAVIRVFQEESMSETGYGPVPRDHIRMCANDPADRGWKLDDFGALDWTKDACFTLDAKTRALTAGCPKYDGTIIEGRL
jgi:hypothetical protein